MRRFFQSAGPGADGVIALDGEEAHHAAQVIRLRERDRAMVLDGRGSRHFCTVLSVSRREVRLRVDETQVQDAPVCRVRLVQAITKGKSFELILQKAVELGAAEILPLLTERVVARPAAEDFVARQEKWQQLAVEAVKQCGAAWLPEVMAPGSTQDALRQEQETELVLVAALVTDAVHLRTVFEDFVSKHSRKPRSVSVWIGPEGDFTAGETNGLREAGARMVTLGSNVLRSETAAIYALAVLVHELSFRREFPSIAQALGTGGQDVGDA